MCIKCKILSFHRFLITKIDLKNIKHRKIVQQIFSKYIPDNNEIKLNCVY